MNWKLFFLGVGVFSTLFLFQNCGSVDTSESLLSADTELPEDSGGGADPTQEEQESQAFSVPVGDPPVVTASCDMSEMSLDWAVAGENGNQWWISRYADLDSGAGAADYTGGQRTTNGFQQIEVRAPFLMSNGERIPVQSMETGTVVEVVSSFDDVIVESNSQCEANRDMRNYVIVEHANGYRLIYYGLAKNSVTLQVGSSVAKGQVLGGLSSNGCSFYPNVQIELRNCQGESVSIMENRELLLGTGAPEYGTPGRKIVHSVFNTGGRLTIAEFYRLNQDVLSIPESTPVFGQHIFVLNVKQNDFIRCVIKEKDNPGVVVRTATIDVVDDFESSFWRCHFEMAALSGEYLFEWKINGQTLQEQMFTVEP